MNMRSLWQLTLIIAFSVVLINLFMATRAAAQDRTVSNNIELIIDASGSMRGRLNDGTTKMSAAKKAVLELVGNLSSDVNLAFRAYGHQFHRSKHNCTDTALVVPFAQSGNVTELIVEKSNALTPQGYTPITYVLGLAADDLKPLTGKKTIVLVSDGKETCEGDPCVLARKLIAANADLTIHTVGLGVDFQARTQLQCIARAGKGIYRDANSASELFETLKETTVAQVEEETIVVVKKETRGKLKIVGPYFNEVVDAETGEEVAKITDSRPEVELLAGIYHVQFGKNNWLRSVEIIAGETTTITPGRLKIIGPYFNAVVDPETGTQVEKATDSHNDFPMLAGIYDVKFGNAIWRGVEIKEGETTTLNPGRLAMDNPYFNAVLDPETGEKLDKLTDSRNDIPLPPGTYDLQFGDAIWRSIEIASGKTTTINPGHIKMEGAYFNKIIDAKTGKKVDKLTDSRADIVLPPGDYKIAFGKNLFIEVTLDEGSIANINPARIKVKQEGSFSHKLTTIDGELVTRLTSGTSELPLPAGKYILLIDDQKVPVTLKEGVRKVIKIR